jgi:hypothetical protein
MFDIVSEMEYMNMKNDILSDFKGNRIMVSVRGKYNKTNCIMASLG